MIAHDDEETRKSLWRAARRFNELMKVQMLAATVEDIPLCL